MNSVLQNMLSKYEIKNREDETNAIKEIIQEIVLCGLSRGRFFRCCCFLRWYCFKNFLWTR